MANEKHKSKYKKPENKKPTYRKDLKDYTLDDKDGKLNPNSTGDKQLNVLRKTDKEVVDNGNLVPKYEADDRLYKDLEDGEYDPKTAAKRLKKRQDAEEKEVKDALKDKVENLTREQKERIVREYIRRKIEGVLLEQETPEDPEVPAEDPEIPAEPAAIQAPEAPAAAPTNPPAPEPAVPEPAPTDDVTADTPMDDVTAENIAIEKFVNKLRDDGGNIARIKTLAKVINMTLSEAEPEDKSNFFKLLRQLAIKKLQTIGD